MADKLTIRCVYMHDGGFFSKNKEISKGTFEELKAALARKEVINDSTGRLVYVEEAFKTT